MNKSELMDVIHSELAAIEESKNRIKKHVAKLNEINPLSLGQELVVNGYSHSGKTIVVDKVFVSDRQGKDVTVTANMPVNFTATGPVKRVDGSLGSYIGVHNVSIAESKS